MDVVPLQYSCMSTVECPVKCQVAVLDANGKALMMLPTADKPLVKGHNFFASGHCACRVWCACFDA